MSESYQRIPLASIFPAEWNPRQSMDEHALTELAASVEEHGVIEPIIVRPIQIGGFEVVAGSRRLAAAQRCELEDVPAIVRDVSSDEAAEIAVIENLQDENLSPLDEAVAFQRLLASGRDGGISGLARRMGKGRRFIHRRLALLDLSDDIRTALVERRITVRHADLLTRLEPTAQEEGLDQCFYLLYGQEHSAEPAPVGQLQQWIDRNARVKLDAESVDNYFPELVDESKGEKPEDIEKLLPVSEMWYLGDDDKDLLSSDAWIEVGGDTRPDCEHSVPAIVLHGGPMRRLRVCATDPCPVHRPAPEARDEGSGPVAPGDAANAGGPKQKSSWEIADDKRRRLQQAWTRDKKRYLEAFVKQTEGRELTHDVLQTVFTTRMMKELRKVLGNEWEVSLENLAQALAFRDVLEQTWDRGEFLKTAREYGFKAPRKPAAKKGARKARPKKAKPVAEAPAADDAPDTADPDAPAPA